ncbi:reverse transcriptase domain-containing protein [Accumulibacter sp.]|uniref:reverse transcriptase domain-containing protein n=1 Tax=Accumulibacter sp. TaxID=2053492 RepID=UPI00342A991C
MTRADPTGHFDGILHADLMKRVTDRVVDRQVLQLVRRWLEAPVEEDDEHGHRQRTPSNRDTARGTPQGTPIPPLLSNLCMRRLILGWKTLGYARRRSARIVNHAEDLVICCKGRGDDVMGAMRAMMATLMLTVNDDETHRRSFAASSARSSRRDRKPPGTSACRRLCRLMETANRRRRFLVQLPAAADRDEKSMLGDSAPDSAPATPSSVQDAPGRGVGEAPAMPRSPQVLGQRCERLSRCAGHQPSPATTTAKAHDARPYTSEKR